jgi:hypothetical protein
VEVGATFETVEGWLVGAIWIRVQAQKLFENSFGAVYLVKMEVSSVQPPFLLVVACGQPPFIVLTPDVFGKGSALPVLKMGVSWIAVHNCQHFPSVVHVAVEP